jgi:hypothetical protein
MSSETLRTLARKSANHLAFRQAARHRSWSLATPQRPRAVVVVIACSHLVTLSDGMFSERLRFRRLQLPHDSLEVCHPSDDTSSQVRSTQVCLTWHLPPLGFLNPSVVYSFAALPVLFHTGAVHGVQRAVVLAYVLSLVVSRPTRVCEINR